MLGSCPVTVIIIYRVTAIKYRVIIYRFDCTLYPGIWELYYTNRQIV